MTRSSRSRELADALRPFAAFYEAMREMGGTFPKTGPFHGLESRATGFRELTVEDYELAWRLLNPEDSSPSSLPETKT